MLPPAKIRENKKLFHENIADNSEVVIKPGPVRGRIIRKKAERVLHPSTFAASSSSEGRLSKYGIMTQTINGTLINRWLRINAR